MEAREPAAAVLEARRAVVTRALRLALPSLLGILIVACKGPSGPPQPASETDATVSEGAAGSSEQTDTGSGVESASLSASPGAQPTAADLEPVTLILDWQPNTNHTGLFVARDRGFFEAAGLSVEIIQPGEVYAEQAVAGGAADFGVSFQEALSLARADAVPLVSIAAIVQHNSSGFAARAELEVAGPADYAGLRYGTFGTPFEQPTIAALMACAGADPAAIASVERVDIGFSDPLALLAADRIDLAWIFQGWQGIQADREGLELDRTMLEDAQDCIPDYYTPLLMARQALIDERPELVRAFVGAIAAGYDFAIQEPTKAAEILLAAAPELDRELVLESQAWISPRYQDDAPRWGEQRAEVWQAYADWMLEQGILDAPLDSEAAFSNEFLP